MTELQMTDDQKKALESVRARWAEVLTVCKAFGSDNAIMVKVRGESGLEMTLGIEEDGYTHS